eukprot:GEMP01011555.1.p1 GENE.GEMP01011555.1~~GEMP01011555.1.p1  ORF type:complete len:258 (+),score=31.61 GEMP01011555.1:69-842(+)
MFRCAMLILFACPAEGAHPDILAWANLAMSNKTSITSNSDTEYIASLHEALNVIEEESRAVHVRRTMHVQFFARINVTSWETCASMCTTDHSCLLWQWAEASMWQWVEAISWRCRMYESCPSYSTTCKEVTGYKRNLPAIVGRPRGCWRMKRTDASVDPWTAAHNQPEAVVGLVRSWAMVRGYWSRRKKAKKIKAMEERCCRMCELCSGECEHFAVKATKKAMYKNMTAIQTAALNVYGFLRLKCSMSRTNEAATAQ